MKRSFYLAISVITFFFACGQENSTPEKTEKPEEVIATGIKLSNNKITLEKGDSEVLTVTYTPENVTNKNLVWTCYNEDIATVVDGTVTAIAPGTAFFSVKCEDVYDNGEVIVVLSAQKVKLNHSSLVLVKGDRETLVATVEPEGSTDSVTWETSDPSVITVENGILKATGTGKAIIIAKAGKQETECEVNVISFPEGAIDLGIIITREDGTRYNLLWAECNIGADAPEKTGDYFAWGEVEPHYITLDPLFWKEGMEGGYCWGTYKWCKGTFNTLTKYCPEYASQLWAGEGEVDRKDILDDGPDGDDVASRQLGGKWRMPRDNEFRVLMECVSKWGTLNGIKGRYFMSKTPGSTNCIFMPMTQMFYDNSMTDTVSPDGSDISEGCYWASTNSNNSQGADNMSFNSYGIYFNNVYRFLGMPVRAVRPIALD